MSTFILQLSPMVLVMAWILILRKPPVQAALLGVAWVLGLWIWGGVAAPFSLPVLQSIAQDTGVLFLSTASVIVPGLAFVILLERGGAPQAIGNWVKALGWSPPKQVIFIVLGLAPLLEAMTGFGVSLIATVPLLMGLFKRESGMKMALAGMVVMPWGTLGLATLIGALLVNLPASTLGSHSALISAPVFFSLAAIALWQGGIRTASSYLGLVGVSVLFVTVLYTVNKGLGPEVSGVLAGLAVVCVGLGMAFYSRKRALSWPATAWPYLALLGVIVLLRGVLTLTHWDALWTVAGERVAWKPLASPGVALLLVTMVMSFKLKTTPSFPWSALYKRAKFPVTTIFLFLLLSQVMVKAGFLLEAQRGLQSLSGFSLAPTMALLAGLAGYVTGSNVGGNTLIMPSITALSTEHGPWLAAMVNSAAGHGALGSLSILSLVTGLAAANRQEENQLIRFAFGLVLLNIVLVALTGMVIFSLV